MPTFFVQPAQPTALSDRCEVELPGYELWTNMVCREFFRSTRLDDHNIGISIQIQNVHILVGSLDVVKFNAALSGTLQLWPHAAGTLTECGNKYQASFTISSR